MNADDFESRLARIPLNPPPAEWRDAILGAARTMPALDNCHRGSPATPKAGPPRSAWRRWLASLSAPIPTLAGAWAVALALYVADRRLEQSPARGDAPTRVSLAAAREHCERILALSTNDDGHPSPTMEDPPSTPLAPVDRPRSAVPVPPVTSPATAFLRMAWS